MVGSFFAMNLTGNEENSLYDANLTIGFGSQSDLLVEAVSGWFSVL